MSRSPRVWVIRGGERNRLVGTFVDESVIGVGYASVPDAHLLGDGELEHHLTERGSGTAAASSGSTA